MRVARIERFETTIMKYDTKLNVYIDVIFRRKIFFARACKTTMKLVESFLTFLIFNFNTQIIVCVWAGADGFVILETSWVSPR